MRFSVKVEKGDIIEAICDEDEEDILRFIQRIDLTYASWDFTKKVFNWYKEQMDILDKDLERLNEK